LQVSLAYPSNRKTAIVSSPKTLLNLY
jgi:hypothetical protein